MNTSIVIKSHHFEGFSYVEFNGQFFKGCRRCGGTGHYSFNGSDSICYGCGNMVAARLGDLLGDEAAAQKWCHEKAVRANQRDRKREQERLARLATRQAAWDALAAAHPAVWGLVSKAADIASFTENRESNVTERDSFVRSLADQLWNFDERQYTERQIAALQKVADKRAASQEEAGTPAPAGRVVVTGEIVGTKLAESDYGTAFKITVKDDRGFRVYVSIPKAQAEEAEFEFLQANENPYTYGYSVWFEGSSNEPEVFKGVKGRRITFTATLEPSSDDVSFAFGSRPTKGAWL